MNGGWKNWRGWVFAGVLAMAAVPVMQAQGGAEAAKDDLFTGTEKFAQGASNVNEITMDPDSLGLVNGDRARRAHHLVLNVVRTYEYDKPGMYRMEDVDAFRKKLETGDWHCSVHTRDLKRGDSTDVCNRRRSDGMVETAIITVAPKSLTFIHTVRKPGDDQSREGLPAISGFGAGLDAGRGARELAQLAMLGPLMNGEMEGLAARMAALGPRLAAEVDRLQALQPELRQRLQMRDAPRLPGQPDSFAVPNLRSTPPSPLPPSTPRQPE